MTTNEKSWRQIVEKAETYLELGQKEHYLSGDNNADYPWGFADRCEPGSSHRIDIATGVWITATHPSGLIFKWSFDIEPYTANGKGHYEIDVAGCRAAMRKLPDNTRKMFREYLATCAEKVRENADKFQSIADRERAAADSIKSI